MDIYENLKKDGQGWLDKNGCYWDTKKNYLLLEVLGFCGCGVPEEVGKYIKKMLKKLDNKEWESYESIHYMFFVYWANDKELAEHGTTARCSWLTDKGKSVLEHL